MSIKFLKTNNTRGNKLSIIITIALCSVVFNTFYLIYENFKSNAEIKQMIDVPIAKVPLPAGSVISDEDIAYKKLDKSNIPSFAVTSKNDIIDKKTIIDMKQDEFFSGDRLLDKSKWFNNDERMYSLKIDTDSSVGGKIRTGDYVDICTNTKKDMKDFMVVLPQKNIIEIRDINGQPLVEDDKLNTSSKTKIGYIIFKLSLAEIKTLEDIPEDNQLKLILYCDKSQVLIKR